MRRIALVTAAGLVPTLGLVSPAQAADPAPTNVKVAWSSAAHTHVRVTWDEAVAAPNRIYPQYPSGVGGETTTTAAAPNQVDLPVAAFRNEPSVRIAVYAGPVGTGPAGLSVPFDTLTPGEPVIDQMIAKGDNTYTMTWRSGPPKPDPNAGDPLDLTNGPHHFQLYASRATVTIWDVVVPWTTATTATFLTTDKPPIHLGLYDRNEWTANSAGKSLALDYERFGPVTIPASTTYGQPTVITGVIERLSRFCDPGPCWEMRTGEAPRPVVLQARNTTGAPWYVVGSVQSQADGRFRFAPVARGTREYRIAVPDQLTSDSFGLGVIGPASTTLTRPRVLASFADPTVKLGQPARARISVSPAVNVRTTLQRWDGTAWRDLKWVYLSSGWGDYTFAATQRGSYAYRFLVPSFTYGGLPLAWQVSPTFVLTAS
ncbi:hypothetical protein BWI15_15240 [Kribbella sp. ALI-6-A]|uniref:hypothetical protein n=1 Tax=Kribbella sp. ALI-6-A TaxID=1933817 RepID=UPI00097CB117|nr:hypothetical protein [Kribbella sp. ALI-6-A]ONI71531.1 hypothetical protein BWI15_15240 [Kribbella sp. ALI-6-A]